MKDRSATRSQASSGKSQGLVEQDPGPGLSDDQRVCREDQRRAQPGPRVEPGPADRERLKP
ncbi:hypothetical protein H7A76_27415 [Pseudomonas sp. MSSRFD41]|uniref:hypothetical protein n=1 Tax=unclassified Pseudomonas TaxID=196821 RepID=UPI0016398733|nr:hypothetical protein [Pseudomonas sp. MSSRFD41]MBC2659186.1 hypothetical protein [Pseudomonas sp. MSSRFD41]